jgi:hypothetical protein
MPASVVASCGASGAPEHFDPNSVADRVADLLVGRRPKASRRSRRLCRPACVVASLIEDRRCAGSSQNYSPGPLTSRSNFTWLGRGDLRYENETLAS